MPAQSAALTTAQQSEFVLRSRMSPLPRAFTNPEALSCPNRRDLQDSRIHYKVSRHVYIFSLTRILFLGYIIYFDLIKRRIIILPHESASKYKISKSNEIK